MSSLTVGPIKERLEFIINTVDLQANTTQNLVCPCDGYIDGITAITQNAITTGGVLTLNGGGAAYAMEIGLDDTSDPNRTTSSSTYLITPGTAVVTLAAASPGVVGYANHGLPVGAPISFTTTGTLPTGITSAQQYYVAEQGYGVNSFSVTSTVGGGGPVINFTGSPGPVQTAKFGMQGTVPVTNCALTITSAAAIAAGGITAGAAVPAGDNTNLVKAGQLLTLGMASFATAGSLSGFIRFRSNP